MNACASLTALRLLAHSSYTVLDSSDHTVFLHVNHDGQGEGWGHVYTSNSYGLNYTLSLPGNRRAANGKCDFEKVSQCTVSASALCGMGLVSLRIHLIISSRLCARRQ